MMNTQSNTAPARTLKDVLLGYRRAKADKRGRTRERTPSLYGRAKIKGHITARLRNKETGKLEAEFEVENAVATFFFQYLLYWDYNATNNAITILNSPGPFSTLEASKPGSIVGTYSQSISASIDAPNRTHTFSTTFDAPTQDRTVRWIGLTKGSYTSNNFRAAEYIMTGKTLSVPIVQTTTQTLEIVYRLTYVRA
jgi:hypothetical protein